LFRIFTNLAHAMFLRHKNKECTVPPFLKSGDKIAIVAPGSPVAEDTMKPALEHFASWGLETKVFPQIYTRNSFFAGTDRERADAFQSALDDPSVKAIFCARGGYGTARILSHLKFSDFLKHPKWIIGFSDITVLHSFLTYNLCVQSIHAPMPVHFRDYEMLKESFAKLKEFLFEGRLEYSFPSHRLNKTGKTEDILTGGNLSVLYSMRGTPADIHPQDHILFIEDIDEYLYHIDRMLTNFEYGGLLKGLKGLLVGVFSEMKDKNTPYGKTAEEIISEAVKDYSFPVAFGFQAGHVKENFPLVMGRKMKFSVFPENYSISFE
jgi:muramoyltetrapeptide carboxypeptidase